MSEPVSRNIIDCGYLRRVLDGGPEGAAGDAGQRTDLSGEQWKHALQRAGLMTALEHPPSDSSALSQHLAQLSSRLSSLQLRERGGTDYAALRPEQQARLDYTTAALAALGLLGLAGIPALTAVVLVLIIAGQLGRQIQSRQRDSASQSVHDQRRALALSVERFLKHTWIATVGGRIIESTPHAAWLDARIDVLAQALQEVDSQQDRIAALYAQLDGVNTDLGQPEDHEQSDPELLRLRARSEELTIQRGRIGAVHAHFIERRHQYQDQVTTLRTVAQREALSAQVAELVDGADSVYERNTVSMARIEVEVSELEGMLRQLSVQVSDAHVGLETLLELSALER